MKKPKRSRCKSSKTPPIMIPVTDSITGKQRMVDINKFKMSTKIIHEILDDSLLKRIERVYNVLSAVETRNSREFEHQFKLEHHPGRELIAYEIIVNTFLAFTKGRFLFPNQKRSIYVAIIGISYGFNPYDILKYAPLVSANDLKQLISYWNKEFKAYFDINDN